MKTLTLILVSAIIFLMTNSCKKEKTNQNKVDRIDSAVDHVDSIVGTFVGSMHYIEIQTQEGYTPPGSPFLIVDTTAYLDTTYTVSFLISKLTDSTFATSGLFASLSKTGMYLCDSTLYKTSNFYTDTFRSSSGQQQENYLLQFFIATDSIYSNNCTYQISGYTAHTSFQTFTGRKQ